MLKSMQFPFSLLKKTQIGNQPFPADVLIFSEPQSSPHKFAISLRLRQWLGVSVYVLTAREHARRDGLWRQRSNCIFGVFKQWSVGHGQMTNVFAMEMPPISILRRRTFVQIYFCGRTPVKALDTKQIQLYNLKMYGLIIKEAKYVILREDTLCSSKQNDSTEGVLTIMWG